MTRVRVLQNYGSLHPVVDEIIAPHAELVSATSDAPETLISEGEGAAAILFRGPGYISREVLEALEEVRCVVSYGSGADRVDLSVATELGISVISNAGVAPTPVAEYVIGSIIMLLKRLPQADAFLRGQGAWHEREQRLCGREAGGRTLGLIGFGHIGQEVAVRARLGLRMSVIAFDPVQPAEAFERLGVEPCELESLLTRSDVVSVHVPLTPSTVGLIGADELATMRPDALLVNSSRGGVVDERALFDALRLHRLAGAAIDVFADEPVASDNPLLTLENVIATPHIAGITAEALERLGRAAAENVLMALRGERPAVVLNSEAWPPPRALTLGWPLAPVL